MKKTLVLSFLLLSVTAAFSQYNYRDSNRIGIFGGINSFDLSTKNFETKPELGWNVGLSMRGNFYNDFDMVYAIQFTQNQFTVPTVNALSQKVDTELKLPSAQLSLMLSYKIIEGNLSVEFGPLFQVNDKLKVDKASQFNEISNSPLTTLGNPLLINDILNISKFNFYPAVGITAGVTHVRANVQYMYGVNNFLKTPVNSATKLKGHAGILSANLIIYL